MSIKPINKHLHVSRKKPRKDAGNSWISLLNKDFRFKKGLTNKDKERLFSEMAIMLEAGVDLHTVLGLTSNKRKKQSKTDDVKTELLRKIRTGQGLASAMEGSGQFANFDSYSVLIGENTGQLAGIFRKLALYYEKKLAQNRKILSALSYPIVVLATTCVAILFMLKFVVPMFARTIKQFGGELPGITKAVVSLSESSTKIMAMILLPAIIAAVYYRMNKHKDQVRHWISKIVLAIPYIGTLVRKSYLARFCRSMELLLSAKVNLEESILLTQKITDFYPLSNALKKIRAEIIQGSSFHESMDRQAFFDKNMVTLIKIGEEVNRLDTIFLQLGVQYENELEYQSNILVTILEPLMILILALIIGAILIAMYLPMFKIGSVIH